jgi:hypothetical protein
MLDDSVGEKLIMVILAMAAERFHLERNIKSLSKFAVNISRIVNTRVLGTLVCPRQWKVPINEAGDAVTKVSLSNKKTRLFSDNIDVLIDYVFSSPQDSERHQIWKKIIQDYRKALTILRQPNEYSDDAINMFQSKIDDFFTAYIKT